MTGAPPEARDRIKTITSIDQLSLYIDPANIPPEYGGTNRRPLSQSIEEEQLRDIVDRAMDAGPISLSGPSCHTSLFSKAVERVRSFRRQSSLHYSYFRQGSVRARSVYFSAVTGGVEEEVQATPSSASCLPFRLRLPSLRRRKVALE